MQLRTIIEHKSNGKEV